jgi:hypothetical protein
MGDYVPFAVLKRPAECELAHQYDPQGGQKCQDVMQEVEAYRTRHIDALVAASQNAQNYRKIAPTGLEAPAAPEMKVPSPMNLNPPTTHCRPDYSGGFTCR